MKDLQELMKKYGEVHPIFDHFGLFTPDKESAKNFLMATPGSKILVQRECIFTQDDVIVGSPVRISIYHIEVAGHDIEVIEPVDSPDSYIQSVIDRHGECFHHLCLTFKEHREHLAMCKILEEQGYVCKFASNIRDLLIHYYESMDGSTVAYELKSVRD